MAAKVCQAERMVLRTAGWDEALANEGALFDIVVAHMTIEDWHSFLGYIASRPHDWTPCVDLSNAEQVVANARADSRNMLLARRLMPGQLNVWCLDDELEIDLDPRRITNDTHVVALHDLMRELGQLMAREVTMCVEGSRTAVLYRYHPDTDTIRQD